MGYIIKNTECNCNDCNCDSDICYDGCDELLAMWEKLSKDWDNMTYDERYRLCSPMVKYIEATDVSKEETNEYLNSMMFKEKLRKIKDIQFTVNRIGVPCLMVTYDGIFPDSLNTMPKEFKHKVLVWYSKYIEAPTPATCY